MLDAEVLSEIRERIGEADSADTLEARTQALVDLAVDMHGMGYTDAVRVGRSLLAQLHVEPWRERPTAGRVVDSSSSRESSDPTDG